MVGALVVQELYESPRQRGPSRYQTEITVARGGDPPLPNGDNGSNDGADTVPCPGRTQAAKEEWLQRVALPTSQAPLY